MSFDFENHHLLAKTLQDLAIEGLSQHINLPMVVLCGDSDAAKHTVIQAMTGVSLPQEYFNHRFSMEFHLSQAEPTPLTPKKTSIKISIVPASHRNVEEKARMMALRDDLEYTHDYWHALMTFLIGRSIVELADFSNVTVEDVLRIQIQGPQLASLIISVVPKWPPHTKDYVINRDWLLKHIRSSHSVTLVAHDNLPLLRKSKINRFLHSTLDGGGDLTRAIFVVRKDFSLEEAEQAKAITSNVCRGHSFKLGWKLLEESNNNLNNCPPNLVQRWSLLRNRLGEPHKVMAGSGLSCESILSQSEQSAILDIEAIIEEVNTALLNSRLARRVVDGSPEAGGMMREKTALEEKCALLERALQDLQRFDPRRTVLSSSITSSTADSECILLSDLIFTFLPASLN